MTPRQTTTRAARRETRALLDEAVAAGGRIVKRTKHGFLVAGPGGLASVTGTASDWRALKNARASLRRDAGLDL